MSTQLNSVERASFPREELDRVIQEVRRDDPPAWKRHRVAVVCWAVGSGLVLLLVVIGLAAGLYRWMDLFKVSWYG